MKSYLGSNRPDAVIKCHHASEQFKRFRHTRIGFQITSFVCAMGISPMV
jgi:hypothetical protein